MPNDEVTRSPNELWFEELNEYELRNPRPGQVLLGRVVRKDADSVLVDVGYKSDALVEQKDIEKLPQDFFQNLSIGDEVYVEVLRPASGEKELLVSLSKGLDAQSWEKAKLYQANNQILSLQIHSYNRGGFLIKFETLMGFLPFSQVPEFQKVKSARKLEALKKKFIGVTLDVKILEVVREQNRLIFSVLAAEIEKRRQRLAQIKKGQILTGKIRNLTSFGAFVDLNGVEGLIHITQLDWREIKHPSEVVRVGEEVQVKVIKVDASQERIALSRKALLPSPWETILDEYQVGDYVEGRITRLAEFGAFVKLPIGVEGLIHTSQIGYTASTEAKEAVKPGDHVLVRILSIEPKKKRISLSMRKVPLEKQIAWAVAQSSSEKAEQKGKDASR